MRECVVSHAPPLLLLLRPLPLSVPAHAQYTEVVIVGNGPSALSLSQVLCGWEPVLALDAAAHPDELLLARVRALAAAAAAAGPKASPGNARCPRAGRARRMAAGSPPSAVTSSPSDTAPLSLLDADLPALAQGLEGRSRNPAALLVDALWRPGADAGIDAAPLIRWEHRPRRQVAHVALGRGRAGGVWQAVDGGILTLSPAAWMELPGVAFDDGGGDGGGGGRGAGAGRVPAAAVARYYAHYVDARGLTPFIRDGCVVTSVRYLGDAHGLWLVEGREASEGGEGGEGGEHRFAWVAPRVVLATGAFDRPNALGPAGGPPLPGEETALRDLRALERALDRLPAAPDPVLVVGSGLSAADAVLAARHRGVPVLHAFRRRAAHVDTLALPSSLYPEYHKVQQMMRDGGASYPRYTALPETRLLALEPGRALLAGPPPAHGQDLDWEEEKGEEGEPPQRWYRVSAVAALVGARPDLRYLKIPCGDKEDIAQALVVDPSKPFDARANPLAVDTAYRVTAAPQGLYAIGPLAGDMFVRFVHGGAVAVAADVHRARHERWRH